MNNKLSFASSAAITTAAAALIISPLAVLAHNGNGGNEKKAIEVRHEAMKPRVEITIGAAGATLVRGAQVTSLSGGVITASTVLGSTTLTWTVRTSATTEFVGGAKAFSDIKTGDVINFSGKLDATASALTVDAKVVRDTKEAPKSKSFEGTVSAVSAATSSFELATKKSSVIRVNTTSSTVIMNDGRSAPLAALSAGARVEAAGAFDAKTNTLTASRVKIDD